MELVLASGSPRRAELLESVGWLAVVAPPDVDETQLPEESATDYVLRLSAQKALTIAFDFPNSIVVAADTAVELDGEILGKPADERAARDMIQRLSGRSHQVHTGVTVVGPESSGDTVVTTTVTFGRLSGEEVAWYVEQGESLDKAGAYAIQGAGAVLVERLDGSVTNVIGLPLRETINLVRAAVLRATESSVDSVETRADARDSGAPGPRVVDDREVDLGHADKGEVGGDVVDPDDIDLRDAAHRGDNDTYDIDTYDAEDASNFGMGVPSHGGLAGAPRDRDRAAIDGSATDVADRGQRFERVDDDAPSRGAADHSSRDSIDDRERDDEHADYDEQADYGDDAYDADDRDDDGDDAYDADERGDADERRDADERGDADGYDADGYDDDGYDDDGYDAVERRDEPPVAEAPAPGPRRFPLRRSARRRSERDPGDDGATDAIEREPLFDAIAELGDTPSPALSKRQERVDGRPRSGLHRAREYFASEEFVEADALAHADADREFVIGGPLGSEPVDDSPGRIVRDSAGASDRSLEYDARGDSNHHHHHHHGDHHRDGVAGMHDDRDDERDVSAPADDDDHVVSTNSSGDRDADRFGARVDTSNRGVPARRARPSIRVRSHGHTRRRAESGAVGGSAEPSSDEVVSTAIVRATPGTGRAPETAARSGSAADRNPRGYRMTTGSNHVDRSGANRPGAKGVGHKGARDSGTGHDARGDIDGREPSG